MDTNHSFEIDMALDRQKQAWLDGGRPRVDDVLRDSSLPPDTELLLDLIYNEIVVREEIGETPSLDEYLARYPELSDELKLHFEIHRAVQEQYVAETCRVDQLDSLPDCELDDAPSRAHTLDDYDILAELGRGGMGGVYKARHRRLKRLVALKMFQPGRTPSRREQLRFRAEAEAIARLQHANIVQIFEVGEHRGSPYLALELAEGGTLQQKLLALPYEPRAAASLIETLARALQHAHEQNIIHRDLKPANVLFTAAGAPKITDFGLAKLLAHDDDDPRDATRSGEPIGTPRYMSPEQAAGCSQQIGPASDVYALGTLLYECLVGHAPFVSPSVIETVDRIRNEPPAPPRRLQRSIPRDLETICLHCLHKEPARRYESAEALAADLRRFLNGEPIRARRTSVWRRGWMWSKRRPALATLLSGSAALIFFGLILLVVHERNERQRVADLRIEVNALVKEGQGALLQGDSRVAKDRFQTALARVQAEPALADHELGVRGWLDQVERSAYEQLRKQRLVPPLFDERRDHAFVQSVVLDPTKPESLRAALDAIDGALEFAPAHEPAWQKERERLLILKADLLCRASKPDEALALLAQPRTRLAAQRRADLLEQLGQKDEATQMRTFGQTLPSDPAFESVFRGIEAARERRFGQALDAFDQVLLEEPDHFLARMLQALCFLESKQPGEAKVALTACIGARPQCPWGPFLRSQAHVQRGDLVQAAQDLQSAAELRPGAIDRESWDRALQRFGEAVSQLVPAEQETVWNATLATEHGKQALRKLPLFASPKK